MRQFCSLLPPKVANQAKPRAKPIQWTQIRDSIKLVLLLLELKLFMPFTKLKDRKNWYPRYTLRIAYMVLRIVIIFL